MESSWVEGQKSSVAFQGGQTAKTQGLMWLGLCRQCPGLVLSEVSPMRVHHHTFNVQSGILANYKKRQESQSQSIRQDCIIFPLFLLKTFWVSHPGKLALHGTEFTVCHPSPYTRQAGFSPPKNQPRSSQHLLSTYSTPRTSLGGSADTGKQRSLLAGSPWPRKRKTREQYSYTTVPGTSSVFPRNLFVQHCIFISLNCVL